MQSAHAVIFDLDGTLLDTIEDIGTAANRALEDAGYPTHPLEAYKYFVGNGMERLMRRCAPEGIGEEDLRRVLESMLRLYADAWDVHSRPYDGILDLLAALGARKVPVAVLSNKPHQTTVAVIARYFPDVPFVQVQGSPSPSVPAKPDPTLALEIAEALDVPPSSVAFMGDTRTDMQTAANAGMFPVGVAWGFRPREELVESGARVVLETPLQLLDFLE